MLVERRSVEPAEPVRIVGKMSRHPIEDHGEAGAVAGIDSAEKSVGDPNRLVGANSPVG